MESAARRSKIFGWAKLGIELLIFLIRIELMQFRGLENDPDVPKERRTGNHVGSAANQVRELRQKKL